MPMLKVMECDLVINNPSDISNLIDHEGDLEDKSILINGELLSSKHATSATTKMLTTILIQHRRRGLDVVIYKTKDTKLSKLASLILPKRSK